MRQPAPGGEPAPSEVLIESRALRRTARGGRRSALGGALPQRRRQRGVDAKASRGFGEGRASRPDGRSWMVDACGVIDETDGHHPRHTVWSWSAGVGEAADGRAVGWNLVEGVNDPPTGSERAIWVDGKPTEAPRSRFEGLGAITFDDGSRLAFAPEAERSRRENRLLVRYSYRQPFGVFTGTPAGWHRAGGGPRRDGAPRRPLVAANPAEVAVVGATTPVSATSAGIGVASAGVDGSHEPSPRRLLPRRKLERIAPRKRLERNERRYVRVEQRRRAPASRFGRR